MWTRRKDTYPAIPSRLPPPRLGEPTGHARELVLLGDQHDLHPLKHPLTPLTGGGGAGGGGGTPLTGGGGALGGSQVSVGRRVAGHW